ncbi:unnamed protein product [Darwinula stevensoni]|uniref:Ricin B lectin domain-containing protein n=1 Tax=Darwinula stevensoni TaxID=69355 RepID=A0A7R9FUB4_9CRUS|nr:unnamed protein product [Darwinula stevensoni]CAG0909423.1 unnamed protein product [Darwinula stevensoni]
MRSMSRDACVQRPGTVGGGQPTGPPSFSPCVVELYPLQLFVVSEGGYIMSDESICLDSPDSTFDDPQVRFLACAQLERQQWDVDFQKGKVVHRESKKCLEATSDGRMTLKPCSSSAGQRWAFESQDWL